MSARKSEIAALEEALLKLDAFTGAARGETTTCAVFRGYATGDGQRQDIARYVETWIREPLVAALRGAKGERDYSNELLLDGYRTGNWWAV